MGIISVHLNLNKFNSLSARCRFGKMFDNTVTLKTFETEFSNCRDSNLKISENIFTGDSNFFEGETFNLNSDQVCFRNAF